MAQIAMKVDVLAKSDVKSKKGETVFKMEEEEEDAVDEDDLETASYSSASSNEDILLPEEDDDFELQASSCSSPRVRSEAATPNGLSTSTSTGNGSKTALTSSWSSTGKGSKTTLTSSNGSSTRSRFKAKAPATGAVKWALKKLISASSPEKKPPSDFDYDALDSRRAIIDVGDDEVHDVTSRGRDVTPSLHDVNQHLSSRHSKLNSFNARLISGAKSVKQKVFKCRKCPYVSRGKGNAVSHLVNAHQIDKSDASQFMDIKVM